MSDPTRRTVRDEDAFDVERDGRLAARARRRRARTGTPRGAAVPRRRVEPDLPAALPRPRPDPAPAAVGREGQERARHEPRVHHPVAAGAGVLLRRRGWSRSATTQDVIGSDFYVMERLDGTILRRDLPDGLDAAPRRTPARCARSFLDVLVELHQVDPSEAGLDDLGRGAGYVAPPGRRLVGPLPQGAHRQRRRLRAGDGLARRAPARRRRARCVIHNDFRLDNVVLDRRRPAAGRRRPRLGDGHPRRPADGPRRRAGLLDPGRRRRGLPRRSAASRRTCPGC